MLSAKIVNLKMYTLYYSIYITFSNDRTIEKEDRPVVAGDTNREVSPGCDYREVMQGSSFVMMGVLYFTVPEYTVNSTDTAAKSLQSYPTLRPHLGSPGTNRGVGCHFLLQCIKVKSESEFAQSCPTLHNPMDCSPPGSSVHGIFQARVLEGGAIAFSE